MAKSVKLEQFSIVKNYIDESSQSIRDDLADVAISGSYNDLSNKPTIPSKTSQLENDSEFVEADDLSDVATSGDYNDLGNKPTFNGDSIISVTDVPVIPLGYTRLKYIYVDGNVYFDTGVNPSGGDTFEATFEITKTPDSSYRGIYGASSAGGNSDFYISYNTTLWFFNAGYTVPPVGQITSYKANLYSGALSVLSINNGPYLDGGYWNEVPHTLMILTRHSTAAKAIGNFYGLTWWRNGTAFHEYVPAKRDSDGAIGIYDTIANTFILPASGTAVAGPDNKGITIKLTGQVPIENGGTGANTAADARTNLGLSTVASTGSYNDLSDKPTIPSKGSIVSGNTGYVTGGDAYAGLSGKANTSHTHIKSQITDFPAQYLISASVADRTLTITKQDGGTVDFEGGAEFASRSEIQAIFS